MNTTPETHQKSTKTLKGQLFGAVAMMLVAAIALGTSTYAWFINNRAVTVEDMKLTVSASSSMLVALEKYDTATKTGAGAYTGYKSVIINDDIIGAAADQAGWTEFLKQDMVPASITDASLVLADPAFYATNNHVSNGLLDEFEPVPSADAEVNGTMVYGLGQGPVKKLGLRFVSSNDLDVFFGKDDIVTAIGDMITPVLIDEAGLEGDALTKAQTANAAAKTQANEIKAALRVAVVAQESGTDASGSAAANAYTGVEYHTFQFDAGEKLVPANKNNTDYSGHTTVNINEANGVYGAIASVDASKHITADGALTALVPDHATANKNANNAMAEIKDGEVTYPATDAIKLFSLTKDVARDVDVYIWLEGTDQDCLNGISGYNFNLKLPFVGADKPVTP